MVFLAVGTFAIYSSDGILQDYAKGRSSFAVDQQPITRHPTITICFDELSKPLYRRLFSLGEDFNVTYITDAGTSLILKDGENVSSGREKQMISYVASVSKLYALSQS